MLDPRTLNTNDVVRFGDTPGRAVITANANYVFFADGSKYPVDSPDWQLAELQKPAPALPALVGYTSVNGNYLAMSRTVPPELLLSEMIANVSALQAAGIKAK